METEVEVLSKDKIHYGETYKYKPLNLYGEVASQKISSSSIDPSPSVPADARGSRMDLDQIKEVEEGAGVEIPLSDEEWI